MKPFNLIIVLVVVFFVCCNEKPKAKTNSIETKRDIESPLSQHEIYLREISKLPHKAVENKKEGMLKIEGGTFMMGGVSAQARPDESPRHSEAVKTFWMDKTEVTNAQFKAFVTATGYVTIAERQALIEGQVYPPGALIFNKENPQSWWKFQEGASWKSPYGPASSIEGKGKHPVVQVSWYDAMAYAHWVGKRLPTEVEWEYAARANETSTYYWGDDFTLATQNANFHQGNFPTENTLQDGFDKTAEVGSFNPNKNGLFDMAGNVWEWCLDTYYPNAYTILDKREQGYFAAYFNAQQQKVIRGGSFLCSESYCTGYRAAARMSSTPDTGLEHTGFRLVYVE